MTQKQNKNSSKRTVWALLLVLILAISMVFVAACSNGGKKDDTSSNTKHDITTTEKDEQLITNGNFQFGTADIKAKDYPYSSNINWTKSYTNASAPKSDAKSGIISTESEDFKVLLETLYAKEVDADLKKDDAYNALTDEAEKKEYREAKLAEKLANPATPNAVEGKKILLLNNVTSVAGEGTAQKYTSSKAITLKANTYAKLSVYVKTANLKTDMETELYGANVSLVNTLNGVTQSEYRMLNIRANDWTQYTVYLAGDTLHDATVKVVLGLGVAGTSSSDRQNYVEGQAFFDEVVYEEIDKATFEANSVNEYTSSYVAETSKETIDCDVYTKNVTTTSFIFQNSTSAATVKYLTEIENFKGNTTVQSKTFSDVPQPFVSNVGKEYTLTNAFAYTTMFEGDIAANSFTYISFYVKTDFQLKASNGISLFLKDFGLTATPEKHPTVSTLFTNVTTAETDDEVYGDWIKYAVLINNNFKTDARHFELVMQFGPNADGVDEFAYPTGSVCVANVVAYEGSILNSDDKNTDLFAMLNKTVDSKNTFSKALFADRSADYSEEAEQTYTFKEAYNATGTIETTASDVQNYIGVAGGNKLVDPANGTDATIDSTKTVAGLINTKYSYSFLTADAQQALTEGLEENENIQPIMIYNMQAASYGYIENNSNNHTITANSCATIEVKVKVVGGASAYIYLVDRDSTANASILKQSKLENELYAVVNEQTITEEDGWATVIFCVSAGKEDINFRVEVWNGSRDGKTTSAGYVFINSIVLNTSSTVNEFETLIDNLELVLRNPELFTKYTQELNEKEIEFNKTASEEDKISYTEKTVYFKGDNVENDTYIVYARMDTLNPIETDPNDVETPEETPEEDAENESSNVNNSANFWLGFSSILLAALIIVVIVIIFVRKILAKRKAKDSGAVQTYNIHSRNAALKDSKERKEKQERAERLKAEEEAKKAEEAAKALEEAEEQEEVIEEYQYGEVTDFSEETPVETEEAPAEPVEEENNN